MHTNQKTRPMKDASLVTEQRWSKWLESMRKDVECTFGIMKGRWRILKVGIRVGPKQVDNIWRTLWHYSVLMSLSAC